MEYNIAKIIWGGQHDIMLTKENGMKPNCFHYDNNFIEIERMREDESKEKQSLVTWRK